MNRRWLPGFRLNMSFTLLYLSVLVVLPLGACLLTVSSLGWEAFFKAVWTPRARAAYWLTFSSSFLAASINVFLGLLIAWVLVRYEFFGKRVLDSLVDLPLALPTAVAGLVYSSLYVKEGWLGQFLVPYGIHAAHSKLAIVLILVFIGLPFVVRAVQPVLEEIDIEQEEAARLLGASRLQTFSRVLLPSLQPALLAGFAMAFARSLGEYGSVVFVSSNKAFQTEIAPVLIVAKLEELNVHAYAQATAIALVLLGMSFASLAVVNGLQRWSRRFDG